MGHEHEADAASLRFLHEKTPDLRLSDSVQHGGHLVSHKVARVRRQRAGDAEALQLAARQLVRETREPPFLDAQVVQQALRHLSCFGQRLTHAHARVDGGFGMLQDQLHGTRAALRQRGAVHEDLAFLRTIVSGQHTAQRGLAEAGRRAEGDALVRADGQVEVAVQRRARAGVRIGYAARLKHGNPLPSTRPAPRSRAREAHATTRG